MSLDRCIGYHQSQAYHYIEVHAFNFPYQQGSLCGPVDIFNQRNSKKSNIERA